MKGITYKETLDIQNKIFIDVRSPFEYSSGTMTNAINIPLLKDEERKEIGTIYKTQGKIEAIKRGLQLVSERLPDYYNKVLQLSEEYERIICFCSRGGLRSGSFVEFMELMGIKEIYQLSGGFKSYREFVLKELQNSSYDFIVLHGLTGVGKTKIINKLEKTGYPTINLEALAHNKGSVFGYIGEKETTNQKNFENSLVEQLHNYKGKLIFVESEGQRLGNIIVPKGIFEKIVNGYHLLIETNLENRINTLVSSYASSEKNDSQLMEGIKKLKKRIGSENVEKNMKWIKEQNYSMVAKELLISYYDPLYKPSIEKYNYDFIIKYDKIEEAINEIISFYNHIEGKTKQ